MSGLQPDILTGRGLHFEITCVRSKAATFRTAVLHARSALSTSSPQPP